MMKTQSGSLKSYDKVSLRVSFVYLNVVSFFVLFKIQVKLPLWEDFEVG